MLSFARRAPALGEKGPRATSACFFSLKQYWALLVSDVFWLQIQSAKCDSHPAVCQVAARRYALISVAQLRFLRGGRGEGVLVGRYARLVGAPNCAPSLCSVAGLLLALALQSAYEDPLPPSLSEFALTKRRQAARE